MSMQVKDVLVQQPVTAGGGSTVPSTVPPPPPTAPPILVDYAALSAEANRAVDALVALLPRFAAAAESSTTFIRRRRHVPLPLVEKAIAAVAENQQLQGLLDLADARDMLSFQQYFRPLFDRMTAAANELEFSLDARLAAVGRATRQVYAVARDVVARTPGTIRLASHVESMKQNVRQTNVHVTPEQAAARAANAAARAAVQAAKTKAKSFTH